MSKGKTFFFSRLWRRFRGLGHSRGFGVQSPGDYRFVREVVAERWPYHAYERLAEAFPHLSRRQRRLCRLYLRISNRLQPQAAVVAERGDRVAESFRAGCRSAKLLTHDELLQKPSLPQDSAHLLWLEAQASGDSLLRRFLELAPWRSAIVMEGIWRSPEAQAVWRRLATHPRSTVAFDLYGCGVVFLDPKRSKCLYFVNA